MSTKERATLRNIVGRLQAHPRRTPESGSGRCYASKALFLKHQQNLKIMYRLIAFIVFVILTASISLRAQEKFKSEHDYLRDQEKAIEQANAALDGIYQRILALMDGRIATGDAISKKVKDTLITAERSWIKWRDAEAAFRGFISAVKARSCSAHSRISSALTFSDQLILIRRLLLSASTGNICLVG
jgi:uncharacterized protein YecT (DUF1311 family)